MNPIAPVLTEAQRQAFYDAVQSSPFPAHLRLLPDPQLLALKPVRTPGETPSRFDGAEAWARLEPEAQTAIGAAALEFVVARLGMDVSYDEPAECVFEAAEHAVGVILEECATEHMLDVGAIPPDQVPGIPSLLGPVCRQCGCTERDACWTPPWGEGCSWVEPDLCSACAADAQIQPRTAPRLGP